ncbi:hypothetical protein HH214_15505 [Mucilaginibacter robiniae]|uniref:Uncharacterized protein n=1 Tax=Mucilaginibacter robiniae TaxID=2728022 RepID=A0A7L5E1Y7_9SPHI|nr:hypothetical protein [Mucilaginibacter robiniae]QJD97175.1 hypothetical protein HH214_15505 [Mucilaginibacter robiniae]
MSLTPQPVADASEHSGDPPIQRVFLPPVGPNTAYDEDGHHDPFQHTHISNLRVVTRIQPKGSSSVKSAASFRAAHRG